jgi:zinc finger protein
MPGQMKLCQTNIPHFTDLIIMSFSCDFCGAHSTDTKTSGVITDKSIVITLNV